MLLEKLTAIVAETHDIPPESITIDSTFEELGIDSLQGMNIFFAVEEEFDLDIPTEDALGVKSMRDLVTSLEELIAESSAE